MLVLGVRGCVTNSVRDGRRYFFKIFWFSCSNFFQAEVLRWMHYLWSCSGCGNTCRWLCLLWTLHAIMRCGTWITAAAWCVRCRRCTYRRTTANIFEKRTTKLSATRLFDWFDLYLNRLIVLVTCMPETLVLLVAFDVGWRKMRPPGTMAFEPSFGVVVASSGYHQDLVPCTVASAPWVSSCVAYDRIGPSCVAASCLASSYLAA